MNHIVGLAKIVSEAGIPVIVHAFLDGRDVPPDSALGYVKEFESKIKAMKNVRIGTVSGRYYAMDRDNRWDRIELAFNALMMGKGVAQPTAEAAIQASYDQKVYDEFVVPAVIGDYKGMNDGDAILFANFRSDRAREIMYALADTPFDKFTRAKTVKFAAVVEIKVTAGNCHQFSGRYQRVGYLGQMIGVDFDLQVIHGYRKIAA